MNANKLDQRLWAVCLLTGQLLMVLSSFFWNESGRYSVNGSAIGIFSMLFWAAGFMGLFDLFKEKNPLYARVGLLYALYGCIGGIGFGFEGLYSMIFDVSEKMGVAAFEQYPLQMNLVLFWAGPAFPLTLLVMGVMMAVRKVGLGSWGLLFSAGGLAFPASRIFRIEWIAHVADMLLLVPVIIISVYFLKGESPDEKKFRP